MSQDKKRDDRFDRFVLTDNTGITITLPESAYELLKGGNPDGKDVNNNSKPSGNRK